MIENDHPSYRRISRELEQSRDEIAFLRKRLDRREMANATNPHSADGKICCPICTHFFHLTLIDDLREKERHLNIILKANYEAKEKRREARAKRKK